MKLLAIVALSFTTIALAQGPAVPTSPPQPPAPLKGSIAAHPAWSAAKPEDVRSVDAIVNSLYSARLLSVKQGGEERQHGGNQCNDDGSARRLHNDVGDKLVDVEIGPDNIQQILDLDDCRQREQADWGAYPE